MITIYEKMWFAVNKSRANSLAYVTPKIGFFSYMMPYWVHKFHLMFKCVFNPELVGGPYIIMEQLGYNK